MLASAETIEVVADAFRRHNITTTVVDPVCVPRPEVSLGVLVAGRNGTEVMSR